MIIHYIGSIGIQSLRAIYEPLTFGQTARKLYGGKEKMSEKYYVTMTDKFMSGWGMAKNKTNKLVIECDTMSEAMTVQTNAQDRDEMKYVNIRSKKPYYNSGYYVSRKDRDEYGTWFREDRPFLRE